MGEPGGALVVEVGQGAFLELRCVGGVERDEPRVACGGCARGHKAGPGAVRGGGELEDLLAGPLGRVEPALPQLVKFAGSGGDGSGRRMQDS